MSHLLSSSMPQFGLTFPALCLANVSHYDAAGGNTHTHTHTHNIIKENGMNGGCLQASQMCTRLQSCNSQSHRCVIFTARMLKDGIVPTVLIVELCQRE